jgi:hypothetical protein
MKKLLSILFVFSFAAFITSCDKADMKIKKLNHGEGTWDIVSIHYEYYDSLGVKVISDSTDTGPGEIVFFTSTTLNGLFDYHLATANMKEGNYVHVYPCEVYFDEARIHFGATVNGAVPDALNALWTVNSSSRRKQEWSTFELRGDGTLAAKRTVTLKFNKR